MKPKAGSDAGPPKKTGKRFVKGQSGNPAGMKPGTKHRRTVMLAELSTDDRADVVDKILRQAKRGCRVSQRMIQDRTEPARKARVKFRLRSMVTIDDVSAAHDDIAAAVAGGVLTLDEASAASNIIEKKREAIVSKFLLENLTTLERKFET